MDVSPRTAPPDAPPASPGRRPGRGVLTGVVLVVLLGAVGFLLVKQVGTASVYYYNADQAVARKAQLGDRRFRIQGTYEGTSSEVGADTIRFDVVFKGAKVTIDHTGSEPALFKPGIAVVCEGRWSPDGTRFLSDRIEVKHSEQYKAKNPARVDPAAP